MAEIKISELPATASMSDGGGDLTMIIKGGVNNKITIAQLLAGIKANIKLTNSAKFEVEYSGGNTLFIVDPSATKVGVLTAAPEAAFHVNGNMQVGGSTDSGGSTSSGQVYLSKEIISVAAGQGTLAAPVQVTDGFQVTRLNVDNLAGTSQKVYINVSAPVAGKTYTKIITLGDLPANYLVQIESSAVIPPDTFYYFSGFNNVRFKKTGAAITLLAVNGKWVLTGYSAASTLDVDV